MAVDGKTTITWYGHACVEVTSPGGRTILIDPWFGNPLSPRSADSVSKCDVLLVTHGHGDHMGDAVVAREPPATGLAVHPRDEPVARPPPAGRCRRGHRDEQGRDGRGGRDRGHDDDRRPLGR